jgi:hypothetical protein
MIARMFLPYYNASGREMAFHTSLSECRGRARVPGDYVVVDNNAGVRRSLGRPLSLVSVAKGKIVRENRCFQRFSLPIFLALMRLNRL